MGLGEAWAKKALAISTEIVPCPFFLKFPEFFIALSPPLKAEAREPTAAHSTAQTRSFDRTGE